MKIFKIIGLLAVMVVFVNCTMTENITIKEDGTGIYAMDMDGAVLLAMAGDQLNQMNNGQSKNIDTTLTFKEIFKEKKDSISKLPLETQNELKKLENVQVHMKINDAQKQLFCVVKNDFKSITELQDMMKTLQTVSNLSKNSANNSLPMLNSLTDNQSTVQYSYSPKEFTRTVNTNKELAKVMDADSLGMYKMIFASSNYILKYNFPKKVKKVSNPNATYSEDRKTITIQYPFSDYIENPKNMDLTVEFEK